MDGKNASGWRLPGPALEAAVVNLVTKHLQKAAASHRLLAQPEAVSAQTICAAIENIVARLRGAHSQTSADRVMSGAIACGRISIAINSNELADLLRLETRDLCPDLLQIDSVFGLRRRGLETKVTTGEKMQQTDPYFQSVLIRAHGWARDLKAGVQLMEIARREEVPDSFIRTRAQLTFLSPKIQNAILNGSQPPELTLKRLVSITLPLEWTYQERLFGF